MRPAISGAAVLVSSKGLLVVTELDLEDWAALEDATDAAESREGLRAITGRGSARLGSMLMGDMGGEVLSGGRAVVETLRS